MALADKVRKKRDYLGYINRIKRLSRQPTAKVSGLISLTIFSIAFFGMFAILPTFRTIGQLAREIEDGETVNSQLAKKIVSLERAGEIYDQQKNQLVQLDRVLPKGPEFEKLAWQIQWLGQKKEVVIASGGFGKFPVTPEIVVIEELREIGIELTIQGTYQQVKSFLTELVKIDRLIKISEVIISSKSGRSEGATITANVKATAHFLPEKANND